MAKPKKPKAAGKSKGVTLRLDYAKLSEMLMPRLLEAVKSAVPQEDTYRKAIAELNSANVSLQQRNNELLNQLDKYNTEIDDSFKEFEKRLRVLEGRPLEDEPNVSDAVSTEVPAPAPPAE